MIRVLVVDDQVILREGIRLILSQLSDIHAEVVAGGFEACRVVRRGLWDVLLLDITLPGDLSGLDLLRKMKHLNSMLPVLVLSVHSEKQFGVQALKAGAAGYLNTGSSPAELVKAIRKVAAGSRYISPALAETLAQRLDDSSDHLPQDVLSGREFEVFLGLASGETPTSIARSLGLSVKTISTYRTRILEKLHLRTNCQLVHYAIRRDLMLAFNERDSTFSLRSLSDSPFPSKPAV